MSYPNIPVSYPGSMFLEPGRELPDRVTLAGPGVACQGHLHQVRVLAQGKVAGKSYQPVVVQPK